MKINNIIKKLSILTVILCSPVLLFSQAPRVPSIDSRMNEMNAIFDKAEFNPTPEEEYYLGRAVAANILSEYKLYNGNQALTNYLNNICKALVINSPNQQPYNDYRVMVLDSKEFNAFATPAGHIFLTRGLIDTAGSEDALAGIIAHELAHVMLKHGTQMIAELRILEEADATAKRAQAFSGNSRTQELMNFRNLINDFMHKFTKEGYSASQELQADSYALELLAAAGYSPQGLKDMLDILHKVQKNQKGGFNNTHPAPEARIKNADSQLPKYKVPDTSASRKQRYSKAMGR